MDNTQNFSGKANNYTLGRPTYANDFINYLYSEQNFSEKSIIADIGSGTGKFAKQLLDKGSYLYCVEPNDDMRNTAVNELSMYENFNSINGTASKTTLPAASIDFITAAQAFHWFDVDLFHKECKRILKPNGKVILIWNMRDISNATNKLSYEIYLKFCPKFKGFSGGIKKDDERIKKFFNNNYKYIEFDNPLFYDKKKFISRSLSSSYSLKNEDKNYEKYINELCDLFDKHSKDGILEMANKTVAYMGNID